MKRGIRTLIGLSAVAASLVMSALAATAGSGVSDDAEQGYLLREYCGRVAVYTPGGVQPVQTTNIELKNLPTADREDLISGISIKTEEELAQILEDLGS